MTGGTSPELPAPVPSSASFPTHRVPSPVHRRAEHTSGPGASCTDNLCLGCFKECSVPQVYSSLTHSHTHLSFPLRHQPAPSNQGRRSFQVISTKAGKARLNPPLGTDEALPFPLLSLSLSRGQHSLSFVT